MFWTMRMSDGATTTTAADGSVNRRTRAAPNGSTTIGAEHNGTARSEVTISPVDLAGFEVETREPDEPGEPDHDTGRADPRDQLHPQRLEHRAKAPRPKRVHEGHDHRRNEADR